MKTMRNTLLSFAAMSALTYAGGDLNAPAMEPLTDLIPSAQGTALEKVSIGGYGKMDYTNFLDQDGKDEMDIYRFILYIGYQFTDNIKLVSEIEWEHGGSENEGISGGSTGYSVVEQAYLDFTINEALSIKVGHMIVPVGMVNLYHEPTAFYTVQRPETEKYIIPSTWHENGVVAHGKLTDTISYEAGILAGLKSTDADGNKLTSIRKMRQNGQDSKAEDFAFAGRLDYTGAMFNVGGSLFTGDAGQGVDGEDVSTMVTEIHAGVNYQGFSLKGLYAINEIDDASGAASTEGKGYYVNAGYALGDFTPFVQYEAYTTDKDQDDIKIATLGLNYKPTPNVVLKANYVKYDKRGTDDDRFELGMGYNF